jgi:hypothetical protein|nr:MAG TPA: hypothetical protein [Caudoviricetes sp.]
MKRYEREVFANVPIMSTYNQYTDKNDFPNHGIIYRALPDQILRAAFMLTWKAGVSWKEDRNRTIRDALAAIDAAKAVYPSMRLKKPLASQDAQLDYLLMIVEGINNAGDFKSKHQYGALKAILSAQKTNDIAHLGVAGMNLYGWAGEQ